MREIKFRVWEKPGIVLSGSDGTAEFQGKMHTQDDWSFWGYALSRLEEYELMQWTYLVDRNGKDIFEGDIIRFPDDQNTRRIYWADEFAGWCQRGQHSDAFYPDHASECEIIGNIYQNPELLIEKQTN